MKAKWKKSLLPEQSGVALRGVELGERGWIVQAEGGRSSVCPVCGVKSSDRHSRYRRTAQDLPIQGVTVTLEMLVSRWRCRNVQCPRRIFTERIPKVVAPHRQRTERMESIVQCVGRSLGGRPAERLMKRLGMPVSDDSILRHLKRAACVSRGKGLRVVGIDDWAWKKGHNYGTILVDLETRTVADLLPDRSAQQVELWLKEHPNIKIVSRDRFGLYAQAAQRGAPAARQVADRFHLLLNLREAVEHELSRERRNLFYVTPTLPTAKAIAPSATRSGYDLDGERAAQYRDVAAERRAAKQVLFETVHRLRQSGMKVSEIVRKTNIGRDRVDKWIRVAELPERQKMEPRPDSPAFFRDHLARRWKDGCTHLKTLLAELRALGYTGCFSGLARFVSPWRRSEREVVAKPHPATVCSPQPVAPVGHHVSPRVASRLLLKPRPLLSETQAHKVDALKQSCPSFAVMRRLVMQFRGILRSGKTEGLVKWMRNAKSSGIYSMKRFAKTLSRDWEAVQNALKEPFSNGPVEGHINRLKTLKRQMYGRRGFELLRARLLPVSQ